MSLILTRKLAVYGVGNEYDDTLVRSTQSILHSMAELSHDLTAFLNTQFHGLISRASKMAIRLMLAHHHVSSFKYLGGSKLTLVVCGSYHSAVGDVRIAYAHRANRKTNIPNYFFSTACCVSFTMLRRVCSNTSTNAPYTGR